MAGRVNAAHNTHKRMTITGAVGWEAGALLNVSQAKKVKMSKQKWFGAGESRTQYNKFV